MKPTEPNSRSVAPVVCRTQSGDCDDLDLQLSKSWLRIGIAAVFAGQGMILYLALNMTPPPYGSTPYWVLHGGLILTSLAVMGFLGGPLFISVWGLFRHGDWNEVVRSDLDALIEHFHVPGLPNTESSGCIRSQKQPDSLEPAEYYGLMIHPLVRAAGLFGEERDLEAARRLARHVVWAEKDAQWLLSGTEQMNCVNLRGRKDRERFEPDLAPWVAGQPTDPAMRLAEAPRFFETDDRIVHAGGREDIAILNAAGLHYDGPGVCVDVGRRG